MDILLNYPGFEDDIRTAFLEIIYDYKFTLTHSEGQYYELSESKCVIIIMYDRGDISCFFIDPLGNNENRYLVMDVYRYLYPEQHINYDWRDPKVKLSTIASIILHSLKFILLGDFSWGPSYLEKKNSMRKLIKYVSSDIDRSSYIYKKFRQNDPDWIEDLKHYILEHKITL